MTKHDKKNGCMVITNDIFPIAVKVFIEREVFVKYGEARNVDVDGLDRLSGACSLAENDGIMEIIILVCDDDVFLVVHEVSHAIDKLMDITGVCQGVDGYCGETSAYLMEWLSREVSHAVNKMMKDR